MWQNLFHFLGFGWGSFGYEQAPSWGLGSGGYPASFSWIDNFQIFEALPDVVSAILVSFVLFSIAFLAFDLVVKSIRAGKRA